MNVEQLEALGWTPFEHSADGRTRRVFARGRGPGITGFAADLGGLLVDYGYTVWMPYLVDPPARKPDRLDGTGTFVRACITGEFAVLSTGATARVTVWAAVTGRPDAPRDRRPRPRADRDVLQRRLRPGHGAGAERPGAGDGRAGPPGSVLPAGGVPGSGAEPLRRHHRRAADRRREPVRAGVPFHLGQAVTARTVRTPPAVAGRQLRGDRDPVRAGDGVSEEGPLGADGRADRTRGRPGHGRRRAR